MAKLFGLLLWRPIREFRNRKQRKADRIAVRNQAEEISRLIFSNGRDRSSVSQEQRQRRTNYDGLHRRKTRTSVIVSRQIPAATGMTRFHATC